MIDTMSETVTHDDRLFDHMLVAGAGAAYADVIVRYKERLGITVLRKPEGGSQSDNCIVYRPVMEDGVLTGYKPVEVNNQPSTLASVIAKGFLLTPLEQQDEPQAEPAKVENEVPSERSDETHPNGSEGQPSPASTPESTVPVTEPETSAPAEDPEKPEILVCDRKFANNKTCGKKYKDERYYLEHIRNKHAS